MLAFTNCFNEKIKSVISDLIGVLYLFCFHCTHDDQVDRRTSMLMVLRPSSPGILTLRSSDVLLEK